jgi:hypothetical protein
MSEDECWLVLHCRPGLACHAKTKERAEQKQLKGINAQRTTLSSPVTHHPSPITSASAVPTTAITSITCCRVHTALRLRFLGPRRSDWTCALTGGLRRLPYLHNQTQRAFMLPSVPQTLTRQLHLPLVGLGLSSEHMSPYKASCLNLLQHAGPCRESYSTARVCLAARKC